MDDSQPEIHCVVDCQNVLGECATWHPEEEVLYWTDIQGRQMWRYDPLTGDSESWSVPDRIGSFALRAEGGFLAALPTSIVTWSPDQGLGRAVAETLPGQAPGTRLNDGRCDRQGRFVVGGFDETTRRPIAGLWRLEQDGAVTTLIRDGITCDNGLCFSVDGDTMYFADTPERTIWAYDYDASPGAPLGERRMFNDGEDQPGRPDGSTVDAEGYVWNAQVFGGRVVRYAPDGRVDRVVTLPVSHPTSVCFGGEDLEVLYVTSLSRTAAQPDWTPGPEDGAIHAFRPGVRGLAEPMVRTG